MLPVSLLEAAAALLIQSAVLTTLVAGAATVMRTQTHTASMTTQILSLRQVENLLERIAAKAGNGPALPAALAIAEADRAVFLTDLNGDGSINARNAETSTFEFVERSGRRQLRYRIGRQTMTVLDNLDVTSRWLYRDAYGAAADAAATTLLELTLGTDETRGELRLLFSLPGRTLR